MKIYFYTPATQLPELTKSYDAVADILSRAGVEVLMKETTAEQAFPDTYREIQARGQSLLDQVPALILEGSQPDPEIGYLLAYAIAQKRPALFLLHKRHARGANPLAALGRALPPTLHVVRYTNETLEQVLVRFLSAFEETTVAELPTIKFTLRITPQIERYLHWKTHNTKLTKADFLRKVILEEIMENDEHYKRYVVRKKPKQGEHT